jgi:copper chaperone CopZ
MKTKALILLCTLILATGGSTLARAAQSKVVQLQIGGMTSAACPVLLRSAVSRMPGVKSVAASLKDHSATIEYDEELTSVDDIQDRIESEVGFSADVR